MHARIESSIFIHILCSKVTQCDCSARTQHHSIVIPEGSGSCLTDDNRGPIYQASVFKNQKTLCPKSSNCIHRILRNFRYTEKKFEFHIHNYTKAKYSRIMQTRIHQCFIYKITSALIKIVFCGYISRSTNAIISNYCI